MSRPKRELDSTSRTVSPPAQRPKVQVSNPADHVRVETSPGSDTRLIKVVSWNVNGVGPFFQRKLDAVNGYPLRSKLLKLGWPQLCGLQEVKISPNDTATQRRLQNAANDGSRPGEPTYKIVFSLPRDPHNAKGFGGKVHGVASLIRQDFATSIAATRRPDWDLEGRILIHETALNFVIINAYWINGTDAPWKNANGKPEGTRHDLKLRYHDMILKEVIDYQNRDQRVLLVGDMNVALDKRDGYPNLRKSPVQHVKNRYDFNKKFFLDDEGMQGVDVFRHFHGNTRKYTYHSSGKAWGVSCDRVDHIIASRSLLDVSAIVSSDICDTKEDAAHSDHVPLWVTIDSSKLERQRESTLRNQQLNQKPNTAADCAQPQDG